MNGLARILGVTATSVLMLCNAATGDAATRARFRGETILNDPAMRISAGFNHSCIVKEGGTVSCWGRNNHFQLGGTRLTKGSSAPLDVPGLTNVVGVAAGGAHTCALLSDGTARCWGSSGQLGNTTITGDQVAPVVVNGLNGAVAIAAGGGHTCALLADGNVRCWGDNGAGQLGDGTASNRLAPVAVTGLTDVVAITAGFFHTCALQASGDVRCWGINTSGELGDGGNSTQTTPVLVLNLKQAVAITAGFQHTCALLAVGTARCWGTNDSSQLGDNSTSDRHTPVLVQNLVNAAAITAGTNHTCALMVDGSARCWGVNRSGQLGIGTAGGRAFTPVTVSSSLGTAVAISAGDAHTCALIADGSSKCWGSDSFGQLGDGDLVIDGVGEAPTPVLGIVGTFTAQDIAAGRDHTCAVRANGTVACWGANDAGQIGNGTTGGTRLAPVNVPDLTNVVAIAAGEAHTCAVLATGAARCWGLNSSGQLGDGTVTTRSRPTDVNNLGRVVAIAAGGTLGTSHTCALLVDGSVFCWGANGSGQLGTGDTTPRSVPVHVSGLFGAVAIALGESHSCALVANGAVSCWGSDGVTSSLLPKLVNLGDAIAISGGNRHSCALRADGTAWCWGQNLLGQLGNGGTTPTASPSLVVSTELLFNPVSIAGGFGHSCVSLADGTARCWGDNLSGQLGDATTTSSKAPTLVQAPAISGIGVTLLRPFRNVVNVTTGRHHSCALTATGGVVCWGDNSFGQLGINSTIAFQKSPVSVPSFTLNIDPEVVLEHNDRLSTVTIVAACDEGQRLHVEVTLTQGTAVGVGVGSGACTGGLESYPVTLPAHGRERFVEGDAEVSAAALIVDRGSVVDTQAWTRQVQVVAPW